MEIRAKTKSLKRYFEAVLTELAEKPEDNPFALIEQSECENRCWQAVLPVINLLGLSLVRQNQCRWFIRELARLLRTNSPFLSQHIRFCLKKWQNLGLEMELMQLLVCELYQAAKGKE